MTYSDAREMPKGLIALYSHAKEALSRLNGLYIALLFVGGAAGSAAGAALYAVGGWPAANALVGLFCLLAVGLYATEFAGGAKKPNVSVDV